MNIVIIKGNLTRDPEVRFIPSGSAVCEFGVALNESYLKDGQKIEKVVFVEAQAWGKTAETIGQYFSKGSPILINGKLSQEAWEDKQTGQKKSKTRIVVERFEFCGGERKDSNSRPPRTSERSARSANPPAQSGTEPDDDIPF